MDARDHEQGEELVCGMQLRTLCESGGLEERKMREEGRM
jgi:hypothetical protein